MIHGGSHDPVLIKKIQLRLWTLRSEVENTIKILTDKKKRNLTPEEIEIVKQEYSFQKPVGDENNLLLLNGGKEETTEDGEATDEPEASDENPEEAPEGEEAEVELAGEPEEGAEEEEEIKEESIGESVRIIQRTSNGLPDESVAKGISILSEIGIETMSFFSSRPFLMGQSIVLEFRIPKRFVINADIVLCRPINIRSKIISKNKLSYRALAKFSFLRPGESTLLRNLLKSVEPEIPIAPVKPKKVQEDDDDDFDDLDSLDF